MFNKITNLEPNKFMLMKKLLLSLVVAGTTFWSAAQISVTGVAPASVVGSYEFEWADPAGGDWSTPDFNVPNTFVQAEIMLVDDGTSGTNPQGNPMSAEGCNPLINDLTGKIAMIYRNTCQFGTKALNAQNAGAVGVIIINRDEEAIGMAGGDDGLSVTIPVVMVTYSDGQFLLAETMGGTVPVTVFMGNKQNLHGDDMGAIEEAAITSHYGSIPKFIADNGYTFDLGIEVTNYGSNDNDVQVRLQLDGPSGNLIDETVGPINVLSGEFVSIFPGEATAFTPYAPATWEAGEYTLTYTISIPSVTDLDEADNVRTSYFTVTETGATGDNVLSLARADVSNSQPIANSFPSNATSSYKACMKLEEASYPTANTGIEGFYFSVGTDTSTYDLTAGEILLEVHEWNDGWTGIDPATGWSSITFDNLSQVGFGSHYPASNDDNDDVIYAPLDAPVILTGGQRYLVCLQTYLPEYYFGYDNVLNYGANYSYYLQPIGAINIDDATWYTGWSSADALSLGLRMNPNVGLEESLTVEGSAFPNPTNDNVTITVGATGDATLRITDISGRIAYEGTVALTNGNANVDMSAFDAGVYVFNVAFENGQRSQFNVVKN